MKNLFLLLLVLTPLFFVLGRAISEGVKEKAKLRKQTEVEYQQCLKKEGIYVCKAYRNSVYARMSADDAEASAAFGAVMGGAAIGLSAGGR